VRPFITFQRFMEQDWDTCLDIGSGDGVFAQQMRDNGRKVIEIDQAPRDSSVLPYKYEECMFDDDIQAVWCSHVLEHAFNVNQFLTKICMDLNDNGWLAITVPPMKHAIVGGHLTVWNAGLLLYNLVVAGFNCRNAVIKTYDYNVSVIVRKDRITLPTLKYDNGDIEKLAEFFPPGLAKQGFNGDIKEMNW